MNDEIKDQIARLAELPDDALGVLEDRLVAEAEAAAEAVDADTLQQIADDVQAVRGERARRVRAAAEVRARVDDLMKSIRPAPSVDGTREPEPRPEPAAVAPPAGAPEDDDPFELAARRQLVHGAKWGFRIHLGVYAAVQLLLFTIWATTSHGGGVVPWFLYPLLGWGIGVVAHYLVVRSWIARGRPQR